jgi:PST family polysaccharide transporter
MMTFAPVRLRLRVERAVASELLRFGLPLAGASIVTEGLLNVDYVIVGHTLDAAQLGVYLLAFNLSSWPTSIVGLAIGRIAYVGFARLVGDRTRLAHAFPRTIGVAFAAILPFVLLLGVLAPEVIRVIYGSKWLPATTALRFLLVLGGLRLVIELFANLIVADGYPRSNLVVRLLWLGALVPALLIGAEADGIRGVGIGHMVVALGLVVPLLVTLVGRCGIRPRALLATCWRAMLAAGLAGLVMAALLPFFDGFVRLVVVGAAGSATYLAVLVPGNPLVAWLARQVKPGADMAISPPS